MILLQKLLKLPRKPLISRQYNNNIMLVNKFINSKVYEEKKICYEFIYVSLRYKTPASTYFDLKNYSILQSLVTPEAWKELPWTILPINHVIGDVSRSCFIILVTKLPKLAYMDATLALPFHRKERRLLLKCPVPSQEDGNSVLSTWWLAKRYPWLVTVSRLMYPVLQI